MELQLFIGKAYTIIKQKLKIRKMELNMVLGYGIMMAEIYE